MLQPRVSFLYKTGLRSRFARIFAGSAGIDPYSRRRRTCTRTSSAGARLPGKGSTTSTRFTRPRAGRFPENSILSHDLIESNFAALRAGDGRGSVRRVSRQVPRLREPRAPLDSRRLATPSRGSAGASRQPPDGCGTSVTAARQVEGLRQPPAERRLRRPGRAARARAGRCCRGRRGHGRSRRLRSSCCRWCSNSSTPRSAWC